jgi:peptide deformylase
MHLKDIIQLGDPRLYQVCAPVTKEELPQAREWAAGLDNVILEFRAKHNAGRAIAAPQLGIMKRMVCMHIDKPVAMVNPELYDMSDEMFELWDDCMCFPNLLVRVRRHRSCRIRFRDLDWKEHDWLLEDALSELLQHEVDHLNGILATQRAIDNRSFKWRP